MPVTHFNSDQLRASFVLCIPRLHPHYFEAKPRHYRGFRLIVNVFLMTISRITHALAMLVIKVSRRLRESHKVTVKKKPGEWRVLIDQIACFTESLARKPSLFKEGESFLR